MGYIWLRSVVFVNITRIRKEELCYVAFFLNGRVLYAKQFFNI